LFWPVERFRWSVERELASQLAAAVQAFAGRAGAVEGWEIYWAAGLGTMSSSDADLALETRVLLLLLRLVESEPQLMAMPGTVAFASSAGAIYAGSRDFIITENTPPAPTTAYARAKLKQEDMVRSFAHANDNVSALLARLSTLYGPGQSLGKQQHLAACRTGKHAATQRGAGHRNDAGRRP
jgi:UDP-glucose 4-epimerase